MSGNPTNQELAAILTGPSNSFPTKREMLALTPRDRATRMGVSTVITTKLLIVPLLGSTMLLGVLEGQTQEQKRPSRRSLQDSVEQNLAKDIEYEDGTRQLFLLGDDAVSPLIKFLSDPDKEKRASAAKALAYIGNRQGMRALRNAVKSERDREAKAMMSLYLAGGLVGTTSESDLSFLRSSVETARFADDGDESALPGLSAALTLGMMGRNDSLALLRPLANDDNIQEIRKAVRWIESKSAPHTKDPTSRSEEELVKTVVLDRTFFAEEEREDTSVTELTFNPKRNKALVSLEIYQAPKSARGYDLVLAKKSGEWRVVGIWFAWIA